MKSIENIRSPFFEIFYFCIVLSLSILYTYPLVLNCSSYFYGFPWDSLVGIWGYWWYKFSYIADIPLSVHIYQAYPYGYDFSGAPFPYIYYILGFVLTLLTNEIAAYNIIKLISFPLLALTMYLLLHYLTGNKLVSAIIGLVFAFSPFHVIHLMAHISNIFLVPLVVLFLLKLLKEGGYKNGILFGFFMGVTFVDYVYYAYFICLLIPVFISAHLLDKNRGVNLLSLSFIKILIVSFSIFLLIISPMLYPLFKGLILSQSKPDIEMYGLYRTFSDLFVFSAKPLDYLLPSIHNPFLGWMVPDLGFGPLKGHRYTTHTLFLGYTMIFLGGYALYRATRHAGRYEYDIVDRRNVYLFFAVAVVALVLSAPPFIPIGDYHVDFQTREIFAENKLYLPQYFLYKVFPMFRVYARMGVFVLLAVCILAAFGLREVLYRINSRKLRVLFLSILSFVVFVEFAEFPPHMITEVKEPEVYKWLAAEPDQFPIVEYPLGAGDDPYSTYEYFFYQRIHTKYLVNGAVAGTPADDFRKEIMDISSPDAVEKLAGIGVKYVLIHEDKYLNGNETVPLDWVTAVPREKLFPVEYNDGKVPDLALVADRLKLVKSFEGTSVYELVEGVR